MNKIMKFKVIEIIDADTIKVSPIWIWKKEDGSTLQGDTLRIWGYFIPPTGTSASQYAKEKLIKILLNQMIELKNPRIISKPDFIPILESDKKPQIACDVYLNDVNIILYFPEYKA
jgi:hypothetical protein